MGGWRSRVRSRLPKPPVALPPTQSPPPAAPSTQGRLHRIQGPFHPRLYSYWANAVVLDSTTWVFGGHTGFGPLLYMIQPSGNIEPYAWSVPAGTTEGWYWDREGWIYMPVEHNLLCYNPRTRNSRVVAGLPYLDHRLIQCHSSDDGQVHSASVQDTNTWNITSWAVLRQDSITPIGFRGRPDECQVDASGQWLLTKELNGDSELFNSIYRIADRAHSELGLKDAIGHSDMGAGFIVGEDSNRGAAVQVDLATHERTIIFETWNMGHVSVRGNRALFSRHEKGILELRDLTTRQVLYTFNHGVISNDYDVQVRANLSPCGTRATFTMNGDLYVLEL